MYVGRWGEAHLCYPHCKYIDPKTYPVIDRKGYKRAFAFDRGR